MTTPISPTQITEVIETLPPAPTRDDPTNFDDRGDAMMTALVPMVPEINTVTAGMNLLATQTYQNATSAKEDADAAAVSAATAVGTATTNGTSTTSIALTVGTKNLTTQTGKVFPVGASVKVARTSAPGTSWFVGTVISYVSGTGALSLDVNADDIRGSGTFTDWTLSISGHRGERGYGGSTAVEAVASATSMDLNSMVGDVADVSGSVAITTIVLNDGSEKTLRFTGTPVITNGANLVLPTSANITAAVGDVMVVRGYPGGVTRVTDYSRLTGRALQEFNGGTLASPINEFHGANIPSAGTINLTTATGNYVDVTGTTNITAITLADGFERTVTFTGVLTLTHGANLVLPGAANIVTAAGDYAVFRGRSAGVVHCTMYQRANGQSLNEIQLPDIASATTLNLTTGYGNLVDVTGTTAITAITLDPGEEKTVRFTGAMVLTNGASLVLPGAANITTASGDFAVFRGYAGGVVRCVSYQRLNGTAISIANVLDSPAFINNPTTPTQAVNDNSTKLANTAFVVNQIAATTPAAGRRPFTATGAIAAGQTVALNPDGTISGISASYTAGTPGTKVTMSAVASQAIYKVVDMPGTNKMLVFFGNTSVVVATIDPITNTVSFGAVYTGGWGVGTVSCAYHPVAGVFVIAYFDTQYRVATLTVSGNAITFSASTVLNAWTSGAPTAIAYNTVQNRMVALARVSPTTSYAYSIQLTGTAITAVGTGVTIGTATTNSNVQCIMENPGTSVMVALWHNQGVSTQFANAVTVNANVVTVATAVSLSTGAGVGVYGSLVYHANQGKFISMSPSAWRYSVFTLSGTTITLNTTAAGVALPGGVTGAASVASNGGSLVYDPITYKVAYAGYDNTTNYQALAVTASLSGSTLTADTPVVMNASTSSSNVIGYNSNSSRVLYTMVDSSVSNYETARVWQPATVTTNAGTYVGIAEASIANAASGFVTTVGGTNTVVSGLLAGYNHYVDDSGVLTTNPTSGRLAGLALSATSIIVESLELLPTSRQVPDSSGYEGYELSNNGLTPNWVMPSAGRYKFTADGVIAAGNVVSLNSDGTISSVASLVSAGSIGAKSAFNAVNPSTILQVVNITGTDKVVILYNENGAIKLVAGTMVGGATNTYTIGTPIAAPTNTAITSFWITWNVTEQKIVMTYMNTTMYAVTISLAGTVLTLGTPNNSTITPVYAYTLCEYNTVQNKTLVAYVIGPTTYMGLSLTISGATFSWGTAVALTGSLGYVGRPVSSLQIPGTSALVVGWFGTGANPQLTVITINAAVTTLVQLYATTLNTSSSPSLGYHQTSGRVVFSSSTTSSVGHAATSGGSLSDIQMTTIPGVSIATDFTYDPAKNYLVVMGVDASNYAVSANLSFAGSSLVTSNLTTINTTASSTVRGAYNSTTDRVCIAFQDQGNLNYATTRVWQTGTSSANQWIGIAKDNIADGSSGWVYTKSGVCDAISGLTVNTNYYIDDSGNLQTTGTRLAGVAIATNRLLLSGNA